MRTDQTPPAKGQPPKAEGEYATPGEARKAIEGLTEADLAKLALIARAFWRRRMRGTRAAWESPKDLVQEAVVRTLEGVRRWPRSVSIVKHLDRTMESLSGHAIEKEKGLRRVEEPVEELEVGDSSAARSSGSAVEDRLSAREELAALEALFESDAEAWSVLLCQGEGMPASEIRQRLGMSNTQYATVRRRIRRKFVDHCIDTRD